MKRQFISLSPYFGLFVSISPICSGVWVCLSCSSSMLFVSVSFFTVSFLSPLQIASASFSMCLCLPICVCCFVCLFVAAAAVHSFPLFVFVSCLPQIFVCLLSPFTSSVFTCLLSPHNSSLSVCLLSPLIPLSLFVSCLLLFLYLCLSPVSFYLFLFVSSIFVSF